MAIANEENDMDKNKVLKILETAKDENGEVPMRLVRQAFEKLPEPCEDAVSRKAVEEMLQNGFPARGMWEIEGDVVKQTVCETLADALMDLEKLPSVTPKMKTGKWIDQKGGGCCCSECGRYALDEVNGNFIHVAAKSNFCPNCGVKLEV